MSLFADDVRYSNSHEWVRLEENNKIAVIGISDHAQEQLGEIVSIELPEVGTLVEAGEEIGVVESVKASSDLFAPVAGKVVAINEDLEEAAGMINSDAFHDGWMVKIEVPDDKDYKSLMDVEDYKDFVEEE